MLLASTIGQIAHPFYIAFAWVLATYYSLIPNYAIAIALLTITVMVVVFPITRRGTRSMMRMQLLAPEMKKLQARYKAPPGSPAAERNALRQQLNEEMMALYKEHGVSPTGGCLPMFLQFPIFIILYDTIRGLVHTVGTGASLRAEPYYVSHSSRLYHDIVAHPGHLNAFGMNLADSVTSHGITTGARIAFIVLILIAIALQYIQMKQMSGRNPAAAQANPQMQQMQKIFPIIFAVIYIRISAGVNVYFIVSSLFRIGQQEFMYRHDPHITAALEKLRSRQKTDPKVAEARKQLEGPKPKGLRARLAAVAGIDPDDLPGSSSPPSPAPRPANGTASRAKGQTPPRKGGARTAQPRPAEKAPAGSAPAAAARRPNQPRAQGKRPRRPR